MKSIKTQKSPRCRERDKTKINNETNRAYNDREDYYTASADRREDAWSPGQSLGDPLSACRTDQTVLSEPTVSGESGPIDEPSSSTKTPNGATPRRQADRVTRRRRGLPQALFLGRGFRGRSGRGRARRGVASTPRLPRDASVSALLRGPTLHYKLP